MNAPRCDLVSSATSQTPSHLIEPDITPASAEFTNTFPTLGVDNSA